MNPLLRQQDKVQLATHLHDEVQDGDCRGGDQEGAQVDAQEEGAVLHGGTFSFSF